MNKINILELPLHKKYYADFLRLEFNSPKDSLIPLTRNTHVGKYIFSLKPFFTEKRREADHYVQFILSNRSDIRFTRRFYYLSYEGEVLLNDFLSSAYHLRIVSYVQTALTMGIQKKDAIYAYLTKEGFSLNGLNFDQISKAVYRFDNDSRKALANMLFHQSNKRFGLG